MEILTKEKLVGEKAAPTAIPKTFMSLVRETRFRGRKRHINIWHINNFFVTPVTGPPGRVPESSRPGTRTKMFMFLGFRTQHINFWPPGHRSGDPWPPGRETPPTWAITGRICLCLCAFSFPEGFLVRTDFSHPEADGKSEGVGGGGRIGILRRCWSRPTVQHKKAKNISRIVCLPPCKEK